MADDAHEGSVITGAVTLPVMGTLALGRCAVCGREVIRRSLAHKMNISRPGGRCFRCRGVHTTRGGRAVAPLGGRLGGGMHLALVPPLRDPEAARPWSQAFGTKSRSRPALGFESELGARLEAALCLAEERVELLELLDPDLRRAVDRVVAELVGGVRAPAVTEFDLENDQRGNGAPPRPVHEPEALAADPSWRPWEAFTEPRDAAEEEDMGLIVTFPYQGKQMRPSELAALPQAKAAGLDRNAIYLRLKGGWDTEKALTTPKAPNARAPRAASKPPPAPKAKRAKAAPSIVTEVRAAVSALDPIALLERIGIPHELVAVTPKGRLVLFTEAAERA
jgi:hypothetical protein